MLSLTPSLRPHLAGVLVRVRGLTTSGPDQVLEATEHRAWTPEAAVRLRLAQTGAQSRPPISVPTLLRQTVERWPDQTALRARTEDGSPLAWSYTDYHQAGLSTSMSRPVPRSCYASNLMPKRTSSGIRSPLPENLT